MSSTFRRPLARHVQPTAGTMRIDLTHPIAAGLAAYWLMNEGAGLTLRDLVSGRYYATLDTPRSWDGTVYGPNPFPGGGGTGKGAVVPFGVGAGLGTSAVTVAALVQQDGSEGTAIVMDTLSSTAVAFQEGWNLTLSPGGGTNSFVTGPVGIATGVTETFATASNTWYLFVGSSSAGGTTKLYRDGVLRGTVAAPSTLHFENAANAVALGRYANSGGSPISKMAWAGIWTRQLTDAEVLSLYADPFAVLTPMKRRRTFAVLVPAAKAPLGVFDPHLVPRAWF